MGQNVEIKRKDDQILTAYFAPTIEPNCPGGKCGVIVLQEWWGVNKEIVETADRLAGAGWSALAPDLYRGKLAKSFEEAEDMKNQFDWSNAERDVEAAVEYMRHKGVTKIALLGFSLGAAVALMNAVAVPGITAVIAYYGLPVHDLDLSKLTCPIQAHYAKLDHWCTPDKVAAFYSQLKHYNAAVEVHSYPAHHAFFDDQRPDRYDAEQALLSWDWVLQFLRIHLA